MKTSALVLLASLAASTNALTPVNTDRRAFLSKVATSATSVAIATSAPAFAASTYDLDVGDTVVTKKEAPKKSGNGGKIVGGALAGSLLLSLPFFAPNLARLAGVKNAKLPKK
jgi:hypothetical protein